MTPVERCLRVAANPIQHTSQLGQEFAAQPLAQVVVANRRLSGFEFGVGQK